MCAWCFLACAGSTFPPGKNLFHLAKLSWRLQGNVAMENEGLSVLQPSLADRTKGHLCSSLEGQSEKQKD